MSTTFPGLVHDAEVLLLFFFFFFERARMCVCGGSGGAAAVAASPVSNLCWTVMFNYNLAFGRS